MKPCRVVGEKLSASRAAAAAALLLASAACAFAQGAIPAGPHVDPAAERIREEQQREMQLRNNGTAEDGRANDRVVKAAAEQLNQDFKRIQVLRNDVVRALKSDSALDYKKISGQTAEIKKRAVRMQSYLALRAPGDDDKGREDVEKVFDEADIKGALVTMCKRIDSFVANPRFTSPDVVNVEGTAKAGRDLREIIELSGTIRGSAERLARKNK